MKDVSFAYRTAIFEAINGLVSYGGSVVPVYSGYAETDDKIYIILEDINEVQANDNKSKFLTSATINIEVVQVSDRGVSYKAVDEITGAIMQILVPTPFKAGFTIDANFQAVNVQVVGGQHLIEETVPKVIRRVSRLRAVIEQL